MVDGTHIDLQGSAFSNAYTSGGYVAGSIEDLGVNLDDISAARPSAHEAVQNGKILDRSCN